MDFFLYITSFFGDDKMNRIELRKFIKDNYGSRPDYPWPKYPGYEVFRHSSNKKWFALIMNLPKNKLGLQGNDILEIVNFKCDSILIGSLLEEKGFFPAYHMNKTNCITAVLGKTVDNEKIKMLLDMSFKATSPKIHKKT